jgi:hypothetical protein
LVGDLQVVLPSGGFAGYGRGIVSLFIRGFQSGQEAAQGGCDALASGDMGDLESKE